MSEFEDRKVGIHSKQREQHLQRNESVKAAVYLKKLEKLGMARM